MAACRDLPTSPVYNHAYTTVVALDCHRFLVSADDMRYYSYFAVLESWSPLFDSRDECVDDNSDVLIVSAKRSLTCVSHDTRSGVILLVVDDNHMQISLYGVELYSEYGLTSPLNVITLQRPRRVCAVVVVSHNLYVLYEDGVFESLVHSEVSLFKSLARIPGDYELGSYSCCLYYVRVLHCILALASGRHWLRVFDIDSGNWTTPSVNWNGRISMCHISAVLSGDGRRLVFKPRFKFAEMFVLTWTKSASVRACKWTLRRAKRQFAGPGRIVGSGGCGYPTDVLIAGYCRRFNTQCSLDVMMVIGLHYSGPETVHCLDDESHKAMWMGCI